MRNADSPPSPTHDAALEARTIADFGEQWAYDDGNEGFYGSQELFQDILGPHLETEALSGLTVADIGSGAGRIVKMLLDAGATSVLAVEPSSAAALLRERFAEYGNRVEVLRATGEALPSDRGFDLVISIGVIQFIPDPLPTLRAAYRALSPGGKLLIWVYGVEGMGSYLAVVQTLRAVATRMPHALLSMLCSVLNGLLDVYIPLCRILPLPLRSYALGTLARLDRRKRKLTIYDQLNPSYVKFYTREEIEALVAAAGFDRIRSHHRRGYSWTVLAQRPDGDD